MKSETRRTFPPPPTAPKVLILRAHPKLGSFNHALAKAYRRGVEAGGLVVTEIDTDSLDFDLRLRGPDFGSQPLEPSLVALQAEVAQAAHLVVATPVWWGGVPASFKALIDRTFLPGWAYRTGESALPERGLAGRSARVLLTMDAPTWWDRITYGRSAARQLRDAWLRFVGMRPVSVTRFGSIANTNADARQRMLKKAERLGHRDAAKVLARLGRRVKIVSRLDEGAVVEHGEVDSIAAGRS